MTPQLPSGTVTLLFTDIEASSSLWDSDRDEMRLALDEHNRVLRTVIDEFDGWIVKDKGDGFFAVFGRAGDAVAAAVEAQRRLRDTDWRDPIGRLRVRMAVHTGQLDARDGDYHGPAVNRVARLEGIAHGEQILVSDATRALAEDELSDGISLLDLGPHRLRGLERAERVYQVLALDLRREFPRIRTGESPGVDLPRFSTSFVGRGKELGEVSALLGDPTRRLVTLLGPGGIGKTRLAVESARAVEADFPGGVFFVDLAPVTAAADVSLAIADAIGAHPEGSASIEALVAGRISQPAVVLLDNFEHVRTASPTVADLMAATPHVRFLATSRSPLHVRGEQIYHVQPLDASGAVNGNMSAASRLFYDRAEGFGQSISKRDADRNAVDSIARRVDGLPLAIELVAARTRLMSVAELDARLGESLDAVGRGAADMPERQRTIRGTIDWSLQTLTSRQRALFTVLSVFPAGATLPAIEHVGSDASDDVLSDLEALVDTSLVNVVSGLPGGTRFRQLTPVREYAAELLGSAGLRDRAMGRLVDHYVKVTPALGRRLEASPEAEDELTAEHANLAAVLRWSLDNGRTADMTEVLCDLWLYWFNGDKAATAVDWVTRADRLGEGPKLDWLVGFLGFQTGDYDTAAERLGRAVERFKADSNAVWLARAQAFFGVLLPDPQAGREFLEAATDYFAASDDWMASEYVPKIFLSANAFQRGEVDEAVSLRREILADAARAGYPILEAWARWNLALVLYATGDIDGTATHNEMAIRHFLADRTRKESLREQSSWRSWNSSAVGPIEHLCCSELPRRSGIPWGSFPGRNFGIIWALYGNRRAMSWATLSMSASSTGDVG